MWVVDENSGCRSGTVSPGLEDTAGLPMVLLRDPLADTSRGPGPACLRQARQPLPKSQEGHQPNSPSCLQRPLCSGSPSVQDAQVSLPTQTDATWEAAQPARPCPRVGWRPRSSPSLIGSRGFAQGFRFPHRIHPPWAVPASGPHRRGGTAPLQCMRSLRGLACVRT